MKSLVHRISQVPGEPIPYLALLSDPGRSAQASPSRPAQCSPRFNNSRDTNDEVISGLNHTASISAAYASSCALPHTHARLASGWWLAFAGRESNPLDSIAKFPSSTSDFLLSQAYPDAMLKNSLLGPSRFFRQTSVNRTIPRRRALRCTHRPGVSRAM